MTSFTHIAAGLVTGAFVFACAAAGASASPAPPTKVAEATQAPGAAATEDEDASTCNKSRKRLWVAGEGWIVRRVTICR